MPSPTLDQHIERVIFDVLGWLSLFVILAVVPFVLVFVSAAPSGTVSGPTFNGSASLDSSRMIDMPTPGGWTTHAWEVVHR